MSETVQHWERVAPFDADPTRDAAKRAVLKQLDQDERDAAALYARRMRTRAEIGALWALDTGQDDILEVAGTARVGQCTAGTQLLDAQVLTERYPRVLELLEAGLMRQGTVEMLLLHTRRRSEAVQVEIGRRISDRLAPLDAVDARKLIVGTAMEVEADLEAEAARQRQEQARANRGVWVKPVEDGMVRIGAEVDQLAGQRFAHDLDELVRAQKVLDDRDGVTRSQAQRRADVFVELPSRYLALVEAVRKGKADQLLAHARAGAEQDAGEPHAAAASPPVPRPRQAEELPLDLPPAPPPRAWDLDPDELVVQILRLPVRKPTCLNVHIPMSTLLELDHRAGWVEGLGYVPARLVRQLLPIAALRRVAVDPVTGLPLGVEAPDHAPVEIARTAGDPHLAAETHRDRLLRLLARPLRQTDRAEAPHDPSWQLRRRVELRDQGCPGPGCPTPAHRCELDHETPFSEGGPTAAWNLGAKSPRCHHARHRGWTVERDETTGTSTWTSPTGQTYTRLSHWQPPPGVPDDLTPTDLPLPRDEQPLELSSDWPDLPLWRPPQTPERAPHPEPKTPPPSPGSSWDWPSEGTPPF